MVTYIVQKQLYDRFPPPEVFIAVSDKDPSADWLLAEEIMTIPEVRPTPSAVAYYRGRVETWIRHSGLDGCLKLIREAEVDGVTINGCIDYPD